KRRTVELLLGSLRNKSLSLVEPSQNGAAEGSVCITVSTVRLHLDCSSGPGNRLFKVAGALRNVPRTQSIRSTVPGIGLDPGFTGLLRFLQVSCHGPVVVDVDEKSLRLAGMLPQLKGLREILR